MLRTVLLLALTTAATALATSGASGLLFSSTPPTDRAAAAYNSFASCTECHASFVLNSGNGGLEVSGMPAVFTPNTTYTLTVTLGDQGQSNWGYELTVSDDQGGIVGTLSNPDANSQIQTFGGRQFASHKSGGTFLGTLNGPVSWTVDWTSPPVGGAPDGAVVYVAGNAANQAGGPGGDYIYDYALVGAETGPGTKDVLQAIQLDFPIAGLNELSRSTDRLRAKIRIRNATAVTDTFTVVTRVRLPNGNPFPQNGFITTDQLTLAPGETGTVSFDKNIKNSAPLGTYHFEMLVGKPPNTLLNQGAVSFKIVP